MKLQSDLTRFAQLAPKLAGEALLQTAEDVFKISQDLVPVDTGLLKQSGGIEVTETGIDGAPTTVIVGYGREGSQREDVALYIEYGTSISPSQPFLTPAMAQAEETFKKRLTDKLQEGLK